jgi:hypothetical protein
LEAATKAHAEQAISEVLPASSLVAVKAKNVPGKVLWVDYDAARQHGFDVPSDHRMTKEFHDQLIAAFSFKKDDGQSSDTKCIDTLATKYSDPASKGDGRAIYLGKFCIKGAGVTPLAGLRAAESSNPGTCPVHEAIIEASAGKLSHNLMTQGGTGVLAIIDVGDRAYDDDTGKDQPQALIVRYGNHIRLAHVTTRESILNMWPTGINKRQLFAISGLRTQDLSEALAVAHARAAAEQLRWRFLHGVLGDSNNGLYAEMLDHGYTSTQARTAPVHGVVDETIQMIEPFLPASCYLYRTEGRNREDLLSMLDKKAGSEYKKYYAHYKDVEMLHACGMKKELAMALVKENPELAQKFRKTVMHISKFYNNGPLNVSRSDTSKTSIVDVFHLLGMAPSKLKDGIISADTVEKLLKPAYDDMTPITGWRKRKWNSEMLDTDELKTTRISKYHCHTSADAKKLVQEFAQEFSQLYPAVIEKSKEIGLRNGFFENEHQFMQSIQKRAEFENKPIDQLIRFNLREQLRTVIEEYEKTGDINQIQSTVDELIADSIRNVDQILRQGDISIHQDHLEIQKAVINGVSYAIHIDMNGQQHLDIGLQKPIKNDANGYKLPCASEGATMSNPTLRLKISSESEPMTLLGNFDPATGKLTFSLPLEPYMLGKLSGELSLDTTKPSSTRNLSGYVFAAPDEYELDVLTSVDEQARDFRRQMKAIRHSDQDNKDKTWLKT